jgi:hypothetical protein
MTIRYLDDGNDQGTVFGQSTTAKLGFYGLATPIVRPLITAVATGTATTTINKNKINRLYVALRALGIVSTATSN